VVADLEAGLVAAVVAGLAEAGLAAAPDGGAAAAVGEVGYLETTTFTAIGEVVNTASRLQDHSKKASARLVLSLFAAQQAGAAEALGAPEMLAVRGRTEPLAVLYAARTA